MQGLPALLHEKRGVCVCVCVCVCGSGGLHLSNFMTFVFFIDAGLLIARNHLARYRGNHRDHVTMPGMLRDGHTCKHCPQLAQCMLYHKLVM